MAGTTQVIMLDIHKIEQIFSQNPKTPLFTILADYYYVNKNYKYAEKVCNLGVSHDGTNILGQYILAKTQLILGKPKKAEKLLKTIIEKDPLNLYALLLLIAIMETLSRKTKEIKIYVKTLQQLYPNHSQAKIYKKQYLHEEQKKKKQKEKVKLKKQKGSTKKFTLNKQLATQTMYKLLYSQKKYLDAYSLLLAMKNNKKLKEFVKKELKKIKKYI